MPREFIGMGLAIVGAVTVVYASNGDNPRVRPFCTIREMRRDEGVSGLSVRGDYYGAGCVSSSSCEVIIGEYPEDIRDGGGAMLHERARGI